MPAAPIFLIRRWPFARRRCSASMQNLLVPTGRRSAALLAASAQYRDRRGKQVGRKVCRISHYCCGKRDVRRRRIRHHLKRWLWQKGDGPVRDFRPRHAGPFLVDGVKAVRIQGEEIKVAARIRRIDEYSGHADGPELARWIASRRPIRAVSSWCMAKNGACRVVRADCRTDRAGGEGLHPVLDDVYELTTTAPTPIDVRAAAGLRPRPWSRSTGTTTCRNSSSTSTRRSSRPPTTGPAASLSETSPRA